jgi:microcystin-dependent protein
MDQILGTIIMFAGNFAPRGWAFCNGQLLSVSQDTALFSVLGTTYGGDGRTTFALPDLRGRAPIHFGTGPGLSAHNLGQQGGAEVVQLNTTQIPAHSHTAAGTIQTTDTDGTTNSPNGANFAVANTTIGRGDVKSTNVYSTGATNVSMVANAVNVTVDATGGGLPHTNMQPYLVMNYIIALEGVFPARS